MSLSQDLRRKPHLIAHTDGLTIVEPLEFIHPAKIKPWHVVRNLQKGKRA